MATPTEEIKDRLDIVEFIKGYLSLTPAGKNMKALCPFHQEKTPSFMVSPERQMWHCFGCGEGGDIFKFLMRYENLEFYEALRVLAEKAGVELKRLSLADQRQFGILYDLNATAAEYFAGALKKTPQAAEYVRKRGLKDETIQDFEIGYAPNRPDELTVYLINRGFKVEDILRAGLSIKTERGQYIDRFRGRIMFPIHNHFGKVIGFSGRLLPQFEKENLGKYINSPDTPIFNKSRVLYGFFETKRNIQEAGSALLVEGQLDFLLAYQDGVKNVVATSGTALTGDHLRALRRFTSKIVMGFDADEAGRAAAERSIDLAGGHDFTVYILPLGDFSDPAEAAEKKPGFLKGALGKAKSAMEFYFDRYLDDGALGSIESKKLAIRAVLQKIGTLWSPVERTHWLRELSHRVGISERDLLQELEKISRGEKETAENTETVKEARRLARRDLIAEQILSLLTLEEKLKSAIEPHTELLPGRYRELFTSLASGSEPPSELKNLLDLISLQSGFLFSEYTEDEIERELRTLLAELTLEHLRSERERITARVSAAEESGNEKELTEWLKEFDDISRKLQDIENAKRES